MLPILVDVTIECTYEFNGASSSLQRALNRAVPAFIEHCCDVRIYEKPCETLKLLHGEFSHLKNHGFLLQSKVLIVSRGPRDSNIHKDRQQETALHVVMSTLPFSALSLPWLRGACPALSKAPPRPGDPMS